MPGIMESHRRQPMIPGVFFEDELLHFAYYYSDCDASFVHLRCIILTCVIFRLDKVCALYEMLNIFELFSGRIRCRSEETCTETDLYRGFFFKIRCAHTD